MKRFIESRAEDHSRDTKRRRRSAERSRPLSPRRPSRARSPRRQQVRNVDQEPRYLGDDDAFHRGQRYVGVVENWFPGKGGFLRSDRTFKMFKKDVYLHARTVEDAGLEDVTKDGVELDFTTMRGPKSVQATDLRLPWFREMKRESNRKEASASRPRHWEAEDHYDQGQSSARQESRDGWKESSDSRPRRWEAEDRYDRGQSSTRQESRDGWKESSDSRPRRSEAEDRYDQGQSSTRQESRDGWKESSDSRPRYYGDEDHFHRGQRYTGAVIDWRPGKWGFIRSEEAKKDFGADIFLLMEKVEEAGLQDVIENGLEVEFTTMRGHKGVQATDVSRAEDKQQCPEVRQQSPISEPRPVDDEETSHQGQRYMGVVYGWCAGKSGFILSDEAEKVFESEIILLPGQVQKAGLENVIEDDLEVEFTITRTQEGVMATNLERVTW